MPLSLEQIQEFFDEYDLKYLVDAEREAILIGFGVDPDKTTYRNRNGESTIDFVVRLMEQGEFLSIFAPQAWNVANCPHKAAVFEAIATIQSQYKLLRFDYDPTDGEIRPNVELPIEDAEVTSDQFHRLMHGVYHGVKRFDAVIRHAAATGEVSFALLQSEEGEGGPPPEIARLRRLADEAGGIDELERIACGGEVEGEPDEPAPQSEPDASPAAVSPEPAPTLKTLIHRLWTLVFGRGAGADDGPGTVRAWQLQDRPAGGDDADADDRRKAG